MARFTLPEVIEGRAVPHLAGTLLALRGKDLILSGSKVRRLGARGAEVLLAARRQWEADGARLSFRHWFAPAREALVRLGLGDILLQER